MYAWRLVRALILLAILAGFVVGVLPGVRVAAQQRTYDLILTNEIAVTHWKNRLMERYAQLVQERSAGRIRTRVYPSSQLYDDQAAVEALGTGSVHMVWPVSSRLETLSRAYGVVSLPLHVTDELMLNREVHKGFTELLSKLLKPNGIRVMGLLRAADSIFAFRRDPGVRTVDEFVKRRFKVRVPGGRVYSEVVSALGGSAISLPASELAVALTQGTIDAAITSPEGWYSSIGPASLFAIRIPGLMVITYTAIVDEKWFEALPKDLQEILQATLDDILAEQWRQAIEDDARVIRQKLDEQKATLYVVPRSDIEGWVKQLASVTDSYARQFPEIYQEYLQLRARY